MGIKGWKMDWKYNFFEIEGLNFTGLWEISKNLVVSPPKNSLKRSPHRLHRHFLGDIDGRYLPIFVDMCRKLSISVPILVDICRYMSKNVDFCVDICRKMSISVSIYVDICRKMSISVSISVDICRKMSISVSIYVDNCRFLSNLLGRYRSTSVDICRYMTM